MTDTSHIWGELRSWVHAHPRLDTREFESLATWLTTSAIPSALEPDIASYLIGHYPALSPHASRPYLELLQRWLLGDALFLLRYFHHDRDILTRRPFKRLLRSWKGGASSIWDQFLGETDVYWYRTLPRQESIRALHDWLKGLCVPASYRVFEEEDRAVPRARWADVERALLDQRSSSPARGDVAFVFGDVRVWGERALPRHARLLRVTLWFDAQGGCAIEAGFDFDVPRHHELIEAYELCWQLEQRCPGAESFSPDPCYEGYTLIRRA